MSEGTVEITKRRKPWVALVLSLFMRGLGHIYCGRMAKGIMLNLLVHIPALGFLAALSARQPSLGIVFATILVSLGISLFVLIDAWRTAKHTAIDYTLKDYNRWYIYAILVVFGIFNSYIFRCYVKETLVEAFWMPTTSIYPTLVPKDRILANKHAYKTNDPKRGDLVVFLNPKDRHINFIKRVVAVAEDTVEIKDNEVYVNDKKLEKQKLPQSILDKIRIDVEGRPLVGEVFEEINNGAKYKIFFSQRHRGDFAKITIPKEQCFVLGDNRNLSFDSRDFGPIPVAIIKGRADFIYWPAKDWSRFGKIEN